ncbi:MAG: MetQ/NlpA family ABC transporter substrate-binding protein [Lachnospiraceae bacterium]|nr:MetQ/NlpA family ABC transporter substrate-binding protein [Lachnospiraceae bacterium]
MKRLTSIFLTLVLALGLLAGCGQSSTSEGDSTQAAAEEETKVIKVGASPSPHAEILRKAAEVLKDQGYELDIVEYSDYVQPNVALANGDLDANYFQHLPYLEDYNSQNGTDLVSAGAIHYEPFGIYAGKTDSLDKLADGAKVAVPNDATNEARALLLLEAQGLIKLNDSENLAATKNDIVENKLNLDIVEIEAAQLPRSLGDVDVAVINGNYAIDAGLSVADALATEDAQSIAATTYGNIVAVRNGDESNEAIQALVSALKSDDVRSYIEETYKGAVLPLD